MWIRKQQRKSAGSQCENPEEVKEKLLLLATDNLTFFNNSRMDLSKLGELDIKTNLDTYIQSFSKDVREIFEYFNFSEFVGQLNDASLLL